MVLVAFARRLIAFHVAVLYVAVVKRISLSANAEKGMAKGIRNLFTSNYLIYDMETAMFTWICFANHPTGSYLV